MNLISSLLLLLPSSLHTISSSLSASSYYFSSSSLEILRNVSFQLLILAVAYRKTVDAAVATSALLVFTGAALVIYESLRARPTIPFTEATSLHAM